MVDFKKIKRIFQKSGYFNLDVKFYDKTPSNQVVWSGKGRINYKTVARDSSGGSAGVEVTKPFLTIDDNIIKTPLSTTSRFVVTDSNGNSRTYFALGNVATESGMQRWQVNEPR